MSRLDAVLKRCEDATAGPWRVSVEDGDEWYFGGGPEPTQAVIRYGAEEWLSVAVTRGEQVMDADFIAAARTDLPDLARDFRRLAEFVGRFSRSSVSVEILAICDAWLVELS